MNLKNFKLKGQTINFVLIFIATAGISFGQQSRIGTEKPTPERIVVEPETRYKADIWTDRSSYWPNDSVDIYFKTSFDSYVYIFNTDAQGDTYQIFPNFYDKNNFCKANRTYSIPDRNYKLRVTGPKGRESLHIIAYPKRYSFFNFYHEFKKSDPFPERSKGIKGMKDLYSQKQAPKASRIKVEPDEPNIQPVPTFVEAWTTFYVKGFSSPPVYDPPDYSETARLKITSYPDNVKVYVDGEYCGTTPYFDRELEFGEYFIRLEKRGYYDEKRWIKVNREKTYSYRFRMERKRRYDFGY